MLKSPINYQAKAVRAYLESYDGIEASWDAAEKDYQARPEIAEWHNGRERGYVLCLRSFDYQRQLNIAVFEHRNSDDICAVKWEQLTMNPPTIDTMNSPEVYKDKWDISHSTKYGEAEKMAAWIYGEFDSFWKETS